MESSPAAAMDSLLEVPCIVKTAEPVSLDGADPTAKPAGCKLVDVHILRPAPIDSICFRNYYTHSVSVLVLTKARVSEGEGEWKVCVKRVELMPNCHCEQGGQDWVVLSGRDFSGVSLEGCSQFRLILRQPSHSWKEFEIRDFKCYAKDTSVRSEVPSSENGDIAKEMSALFNLAHSCAEVKSKLSLSGDTGSHMKDSKLPYEVNLLSYT